MSDAAETILKPIVSAWLSKLELAREAKKEFDDVAEQCMTFFDSTNRKFWEPKFQRKFFGTTVKSPFKFSMGKAFELVARFGPTLYHKNPYRSVKPYDPLQYGPDVFGIPPEPPQPPTPEMQQDQGAMMQYQSIAQQYQAAMQQYTLQMRQDGLEASRNALRCQLMERYLSFTPREQPDGGLEEAARRAITEALVKGRGLLWAEPFSHPGSGRKLTGCFFGTVDDLLIDPDARSHHFGEARWIARRHVMPTWKVERRYGLKRGSLKNRGTSESADAVGGNAANRNRADNRNKGLTYDEIEFWEIWSIGGVGTRLTGIQHGLDQAFDEHVGDYAYIVVAGSVPYPLNAPPASAVENPADSFEAAGVEEVKEMFAWPVPYWRDRKWPCAMLDFYVMPHNPFKPNRSAWPQAPLGAALAELSALNIIVSGLVNAVTEGSRTFLGMAESMAKQFEEMLDTDGVFGKIKIPDRFLEGGKGVSDLLAFIRAPDQSGDIVKVIQFLLSMVEHRTGLSEILYSANPGGAVPRSATDAASKSEHAAVVPEDMSNRVAKFLTDAAELEKLCAYWSRVSGQDLLPFFGQTGAQFWEELVANEEPDVVFYGMRCTVEASDVRKPNRERDAQNMAHLYPAISAQLTAYAQATGDVQPLNAINRMMFQAIDQKWTPDLEMKPPPAPQGPSPEELKMQLEQQKVQGDLAVKQADIDAKKIDAELKMRMGDAKIQLEEMAHEQRMKQAMQTGQMDMIQSMMGLRQQQAEGAVKLDAQQKLSQEKIRLKNVEARMKAAAAKGAK